ncbi:MAG: hypothetical protein ACRDTG_16660 [Pseudonocardiaceae bacterium]
MFDGRRQLIVYLGPLIGEQYVILRVKVWEYYWSFKSLVREVERTLVIVAGSIGHLLSEWVVQGAVLGVDDLGWGEFGEAVSVEADVPALTVHNDMVVLTQ